MSSSDDCLFLEHIRRSQTFTEQSSLPVTIRWVAILFQSQTFTSLSWACTQIWEVSNLPTLISTICKVPSELPIIIGAFTWSEDWLLSWRKNYILNWSFMIFIFISFFPLGIVFIVVKNFNNISCVSSC